MAFNDDPRQGDFIPGPRSSTGSQWRGFSARVIRAPVFGPTLSFGSMLAIAVSYVQNESIGWAIIHGMLSWLFVFYAALFY